MSELAVAIACLLSVTAIATWLGTYDRYLKGEPATLQNLRFVRQLGLLNTFMCGALPIAAMLAFLQAEPAVWLNCLIVGLAGSGAAVTAELVAGPEPPTT